MNGVHGARFSTSAGLRSFLSADGLKVRHFPEHPYSGVLDCPTGTAPLQPPRPFYAVRNDNAVAGASSMVPSQSSSNSSSRPWVAGLPKRGCWTVQQGTGASPLPSYFVESFRHFDRFFRRSGPGPEQFGQQFAEPRG